MSTESRSVVVRLRAEAGGLVAEFDRAGNASDRLAGRVDKSGNSLRTLTRLARNVALGAGFGKLVTGAVRLEAAYSKTMAQVAVATKAPQREMEKLDKLALRMGATTVFSARESADAMLSLAKGGLSPAQIQAGALADTLTLASAGNLELGDAANVVVQAMGAFRLKADETNVAVAALAGGANASSASVGDMTTALSQVGTVANSAGFSIQDTTAYLALFADQGFKGSDAGTSLRTMLGRLVPQTKEAADAQRALGLTYLDSNGNLVDAEQIAARTQKAFGKLNDEDRIRYANAIFGQDAIRGVNALTAEGADGLKQYLTATNDLTQAQKLAKAANSGTAGAIENLKGSAETAMIQLGRGLAPTVQDAAEKLSDLVSGNDVEAWGRKAGEGVADFAGDVAPLAQSVGELAVSVLPALNDALGVTVDVLKLAADVVKPFVDAFNALPESAQKALILAGGVHVLAGRLRGSNSAAATSAGNLLLWGGSAEKAGKKAKNATPGVAGFAGALKANAVLLGASFVAPKVLEDFGRIQDLVSGKPVSGDGLAGSFSEQGKATAETIAEINAAIAGSDIGKYADDLGVDMDKLAASLAEGGSQGEYVQEVMDQFKDSFKAPGTKFGSWLPFLETDSEHATNLRRALESLTEEYDKAQEKARANLMAVDKQANGFRLLVGGLGQYVDELEGLPTKAVTEITTPGAVKSADDVRALAKRFELTPRQVRTIMKALNFASPVIDEVVNDLKKVKSKTVVLTTIKRTITEFLTGKDQRPTNDSIEDMLKPYTGMRLPDGYAGGGRVPGRAPSDPTVDNVFARGANTGRPLMVRSGEWIINEPQSKVNDPWLRWANNGGNFNDLFGRFADGGQYGRTRTEGVTAAVIVAGGSGGGSSAADMVGSARLMASYVRSGVMAGLSGASFRQQSDGTIRLILAGGR